MGRARRDESPAIYFFLHVHLQSTMKHICVIITYIQGALFFFFPLDYIHIYIYILYVGWTSKVGFINRVILCIVAVVR